MPPSEHQQQLTTLLFYTLVLLLGYLVFRIFQPFLTPLCWGAVLAVVCHPVHRRLARRLGAGWAATVSTVAVALLIILPSIALTFVFVREAAQAASQVSDAITQERLAEAGRLWTRVQELTIGRKGLDLASLAQQAAAAATAWIAARAGSVLHNAVIFVADLFIALFALFFFFRDGAGFVEGIRRVLPLAEAQREHMLQEARNLINATVTASLLVAAIQGCLGGVTFALLGVGAPVFWGVVMAFCALLPLGSGLVWLPAAIWLLASGHVVKGVVLLAVGFGIIGLVDNFLRPLVLSGRSQLSGLLVFISVLGGIAIFGLLGVVLGPVVVATAVGVFEAHSQPPAPAGPRAES